MSVIALGLRFTTSTRQIKGRLESMHHQPPLMRVSLYCSYCLLRLPKSMLTVTPSGTFASGGGNDIRNSNPCASPLTNPGYVTAKSPCLANRILISETETSMNSC